MNKYINIYTYIPLALNMPEPSVGCLQVCVNRSPSESAGHVESLLGLWQVHGRMRCHNLAKVVGHGIQRPFWHACHGSAFNSLWARYCQHGVRVISASEHGGIQRWLWKSEPLVYSEKIQSCFPGQEVPQLTRCALVRRVAAVASLSHVLRSLLILVVCSWMQFIRNPVCSSSSSGCCQWFFGWYLKNLCDDRQQFADRSLDDHGHCLGTRPPGGAGATYLKLHVANGLDVPHHLFLQADENPYIFGRIWRKNSEAARSDLLAGSDGDDAWPPCDGGDAGHQRRWR